MAGVERSEPPGNRGLGAHCVRPQAPQNQAVKLSGDNALAWMMHRLVVRCVILPVRSTRARPPDLGAGGQIMDARGQDAAVTMATGSQLAASRWGVLVLKRARRSGVYSATRGPRIW